MSKKRMIEFGVGIFVLFGLIALVILALRVSGLSMNYSKKQYQIYGLFTNIGALKPRAKVTISGVVVGEVTHIALNPKSYMARVDMQINADTLIPQDSTASIVTAGLLGEKYISIGIGGSQKNLKAGGRLQDTQSAIVLENLIGKFLLSFGKK